MEKEGSIFKQMNKLGSSRTPFFFIIDFRKIKGKVIPIAELGDDISFQIDQQAVPFSGELELVKHPISFEKYQKQFDFVKQNILKGNSYLTNLTSETSINLNLSLKEIYSFSNAKYKLFWEDKFVCFSPETFVKILDGKIYSYPMKGTIDASVENAKEKILEDEKEKAEHYTIVDLIRNDLSQVAKKVSVSKFRYVEEIKTNERTLLQVSSEVSGELPEGFHKYLGDILYKLLPAGSICGAPKEKTVEIICKAESYDRNFYTGVFGVFDGENLDSAVMIRFIEQTKKGLVFKSGGGITHQSTAENEYNEMIQKVYVPIN
ncbi:MAG: aminodeoxychorismate synthase component I [Moheibacter sp.]